MNLWTRLWAKVDGTGGPGACWPWTGALSKKRRGYRPNMQIGGRRSPNVNPAHLVCAAFRGPKPTPEHEVGHTCPEGENPRCVNPRHLRWMTRRENERSKRSRRVDAPVRAEVGSSPCEGP